MAAVGAGCGVVAQHPPTIGAALREALDQQLLIERMPGQNNVSWTQLIGAAGTRNHAIAMTKAWKHGIAVNTGVSTATQKHQSQGDQARWRQ